MVQTAGGQDVPAVIEGILRYHPFIYDHETCPRIDLGESSLTDDDDVQLIEPPGPLQPVFNCFWNGRLVPKTNVAKVPFLERAKRNPTKLKYLDKRLT